MVIPGLFDEKNGPCRIVLVREKMALTVISLFHFVSRIAYSALKGRAAIAVDTCGGCGSQGTAGSGAQRSALILADGPAPLMMSTRQTGTDDSTSDADLVFTGDALSHNFPSVAQINIEVTLTSNDTAKIALSSSDGTGATTNTATYVGDGKWVISEPIFMGTGWGASRDPFNMLNIQRSLIIAEDSMTAVYQDMGADTSLMLVGGSMMSDTMAPTTSPGSGDTDTMAPTGTPAGDSSGAFVSVGMALFLLVASTVGLA